MTERRSPSAARTPLAPDELLRRSFSSSFRGFDPTEVRDFLVRIADDLRVSYSREQELELRIALLEEKLAQPPVIDEAMIMAHLGEETTRVLASAREAAAEMRTRAEAELNEALNKAKEVHSHFHGEADNYSTEIRAAADADAAQMLGAAQERAQEMLTDARASGRAMLEQAQELRAVVLADLQKRRRLAYSQVEQLLAGRDHLLETVQLVRGNVEEMAEVLRRAELEARAAAESARDKALDDVQPSIEEVIARLAPVDVPSFEDEVVAEYIDAEDVVESDIDAIHQSNAIRIVRRKRNSGSSASNGDETTGGPAEIANLNGNGKTVSAEPTNPTPRPIVPIGATDFGDVDEGVKIIRVEPVVPDVNEVIDETDEVVIDLRDSAAMVDELTNESLEDDHDVDSLFAQMREQRERAVAEAERILAEVGDSATFDGVDEEPVSVLPSESIRDPAGDLLVEKARTARTEAIDKFSAKMSKQLKKVMQNEQNEVLDAIRNQRGRPNIDALPSEDSQRRAYKNAVHESISETVRTGIAAFGNGSDGEHVQVHVRSAEDNFLSDFLVPLRRKLQQAIAGAPEANEDAERSVLDAVGAVYREARNQKAENVIADTIHSSYMRGIYCAADKDTNFFWDLGNALTGCEECTANRNSGAIAVGTAFPSGHLFPLAHPGCRCLIVRK